MKTYDYGKRKEVETPQEVIIFLEEIEQVCRKHNLSISHEDGQGRFIIEKFNERLMEILKDPGIDFGE